MIRDIQGDYGLKTDLDQDEGFSFGYQLTLYFPTHFQIQVIKSNFSLYDAFAGQEKISNFKKRNFQQNIRPDAEIFKDIATNSNLA
jgi:hypothetical protein